MGQKDDFSVRTVAALDQSFEKSGRYIGLGPGGHGLIIGKAGGGRTYRAVRLADHHGQSGELCPVHTFLGAEKVAAAHLFAY